MLPKLCCLVNPYCGCRACDWKLCRLCRMSLADETLRTDTVDENHYKFSGQDHHTDFMLYNRTTVV